MRIGICQTDIFFEDKERNLNAAEKYIKAVSDSKVRLALFPEMSMTGFTMKPECFYEDEKGRTYSVMAKLASKYNIYIGYGYISHKNNGYYNTYVIIDNLGKIICSYDKIHPFTYAGEDKVYEKGSSLSFGQIDDITVCPLICYDLRFPELFIKASKKADLITVAANFGGPRDEHWQVLLKARAIENQTYIAGINRAGEDVSTYYMGHSMAVSPKGDVISMAGEKEDIIIADIDKEEEYEYRKKFPVRNDFRPEIYKNL